MRSYFLSVESPVGRITLTSNETHLKSLAFSEEAFDESETLPEILLQSATQLKEYFEGSRKGFDLAIDPDGSGFQKKVWQRLLQVPYGTTKSYHDIAIELGSALNTQRWERPTERIRFLLLCLVTGLLVMTGSWLAMQAGSKGNGFAAS